MSPINPTPINDSTWQSRRFLISGTPSTPDEVSIHVITCPPSPSTKPKGTILLIHGFPETSYQFRHVITPLSRAGYRVLAPDYRGAGHSSHPRDGAGYRKTVMAADLHALVREHLGIKQAVHVVGHDIGGMIAHAYATRWPEDTASVTWGECPLPGTRVYEEVKHGPGVWHFTFHWQGDLPERLVVGRERLYIKHFYDRLAHNPTAISEADIDHYATQFAQPGAMRSGFDTYRAFHADAADNSEWVKEHGKCIVPVCSLSGKESFWAVIAKKQTEEMYQGTCVVRTVEGAGHWISEENPEGFVEAVLEFVEKIDE